MLTLIIDRKQSDVDRAKQLIEKAKVIENLSSSELTEYLSGLKGCYNISDLNRVEEAVEYISEWLRELGYFNIVNIKKWTDGERFTTSQVNRYLNNIKILRDTIIVASNTLVVPASYKPFANANNIEKILFDLKNIITNSLNMYISCGVANCGQNRLWQQRFRRSQVWDSFTQSISSYNNTINSFSSLNQDGAFEETENLELSLLDGRDNIYANFQIINTNMEIIDGITGGVNGG